MGSGCTKETQTKKMKNFVITLLLLALLPVVAGCAGNNASEPVPYGKASYSITLGDDIMAAAAQVTIKYTDGEKTQSRTITAADLDGNTWTRTVTADLPADFGFSITFTPKPGSELTRESYALHTTARINIITSAGSGASFHGNPVTIVEATATARDDVPTTLARASGTTVAYHVDDEGNITATQSKL